MPEIKSITDGFKEGASRAVLVSVCTKDDTEESCERSLDELARLLETAGGEEAGRVIQNRETPDRATFIGSGKLAELAEFIKNNGDISLVVFDNELTPSQIANIEKELPDVRVIDRTMLILDIFALHAVTGEGKLQVEIACLQYTAPRLTGKGKEMSRLGGGIGTRGPGESKLESDRRHLKRRIAALRN
ncbi:MAG: GTPase HflX, partial [Clostridia bacterium]|nr:GTPase HflX [Clostridia bacterium]